MSCDLDEDPIFLDSEAVYTDINVAKGALDGIYQALTSYNAQERRIFAINGFSGLFTAGKNGGNNVNNINNANLFSSDVDGSTAVTIFCIAPLHLAITEYSPPHIASVSAS